jgi:hypothetical protein
MVWRGNIGATFSSCPVPCEYLAENSFKTQSLNSSGGVLRKLLHWRPSGRRCLPSVPLQAHFYSRRQIAIPTIKTRATVRESACLPRILSIKFYIPELVSIHLDMYLIAVDTLTCMLFQPGTLDYTYSSGYGDILRPSQNERLARVQKYSTIWDPFTVMP